jgi:hypothetical protein
MKVLSFDVGIKNLGYCVLDLDYKIYHWGLINFIKDVGKKKIDTDEMCELLYAELDERPEIRQVDRVVIENQPCLKNPKMKTIQIMLLSYFVNLKKQFNIIQKIDCFLPRNKLDVYMGADRQEIIDSITLKSKYSKTKKLSILFTRKMIVDQPDALKILDTEKKKDDLADSFIQGACYINKKCR